MPRRGVARALWQRYLEAAQAADAADFRGDLDAFWDAVQFGGPGWPGEATIIFRHSDALAPLRTAGGLPFLDALRRLVADTTRLRIVLD